MTPVPRGYLASMLKLAARASTHLEGLTIFQRRALDFLAALPRSHDDGWATGREIAVKAGRITLNMIPLAEQGYIMSLPEDGVMVYKITAKGISYLARVERNEENDEVLQRYWQMQSEAKEGAA